MRPKKTILIVDANTNALSERCFLFRTNLYNVLPASSTAGALAILAARKVGTVDLLIGELEIDDMDGNELVMQAKKLCPGLPTLLTSRTQIRFDKAHSAEAFLPKGHDNAENLLHRAKLMTARKRGPKKQIPESEAA